MRRIGVLVLITLGHRTDPHLDWASRVSREHLLRTMRFFCFDAGRNGIGGIVGFLSGHEGNVAEA